MSDWISVEDRLPKQRYSNRCVPVIGQIGKSTVLELCFDEGDFYLQGVIMGNVKYWMAMPEPHKPDST